MGRNQANTASTAGGFGSFASPNEGHSLSYIVVDQIDSSAISDPNVVVSLKGVLKKDPATKAKALQELVSYAQSHPFEQDGGVEDSILKTWASIYPRTAIDNARRVRELAHQLQLALMKSARKRMERQLPKVVATWLAGSFDRDRGVAKAASDGIGSFVNTPEKAKQFWLKCQVPILDFVMSAIKENVWTLSDDRTTSKDDADAKYHRVLGACQSLILGLVQRLDPEDLEAQVQQYEAYFSMDKVWSCGLVEDAFVRRTTFQLLGLAMDKLPDVIKANQARVSKIILAEGLKADQQGSATDYVRALTKLNTRLPDIWLMAHGGKKSPYARLQGFIEKGSQDRTPQTWEYLKDLVCSLLQTSISAEDANHLLKSMRKGIASPNEPRSNAPQAWICYIGTAEYLLSLMDKQNVDAKVTFVEENVLPVTRNYLFNRPETGEFASATNASAASNAYELVAWSEVAQIADLGRQEGIALGTQVESRITRDAPEGSPEYLKNQSEVVSLGRRWFGLYAAFRADLEREIPGPPRLNFLRQPSADLLLCCVSELEKKEFKKSGPAQILVDSFHGLQSLFDEYPNLRAAIARLYGSKEADLEVPLTSAAADHLLALLSVMGNYARMEEEYKACWLRTVLFAINYTGDGPLTAGRFTDRVLTRVVNSKAARVARGNAAFQAYVEQSCIAMAKGEVPFTPLYGRLLVSGTMQEETGRRVVLETAALLDDAAQDVEPVLNALAQFADRWPDIIISNTEAHMKIMTALLAMGNPDDAPEGQLKRYRVTLHTILARRADGTRPLMVRVVHQNLWVAMGHSLKIATVVRFARELVEERSVPVVNLLPSRNHCDAQLQADMGVAPLPTMAYLVGNLAAASTVIHAAFAHRMVPIYHDADGLTLTLRRAVYISQMMAALPWDPAFEVHLRWLALTVELANDQLASLGADGRAPRGFERNMLFLPTVPESRVIVEEFVSSSRRLLARIAGKASGAWWQPIDEKEDEAGTNVELGIVRELLRSLTQSGGLTLDSLYAAKVLRVLIQALVEDHGIPAADADKWLADLGLHKSTPETLLRSVAVVGGMAEAAAPLATVKKLCNDLVARITASTDCSAQELNQMLVHLETVAAVYPAGELPVVNHRIVMLVKHLVKLTQDQRLSGVTSFLSRLIARLLRQLLPSVVDIYDSFWIAIIKHYCQSMADVAAGDLIRDAALVDAWLKLEQLLETLSGSHDNDELTIALRETKDTRRAGVLDLLRRTAQEDLETQPLPMLAELLRRRASRIPSAEIDDVTDLFALVAATSRDIQTAGFDLIHHALPRLQDRDFIDLQYEGENARLPDELLSLLLEVPKAADEDAPGFTNRLRSYLLAWDLVFDHFKTVSGSVTDAYVERLKEQDAVGPLLDLVFDLLGHSAGKPVNTDKAGITPAMIRDYNTADADAEPDEERDVHWLLVHVCYACMRQTPGLFRAWYLGCESKQTKIAVEAWVRKHLAAMLFEDHAALVRRWLADAKPGAAASGSGEERDVEVSISEATREVTASYELEDQKAVMVLRVPPAYPLDLVVVEGVNRVGVGEQLWQTWIRSVQGVVTFTHGSLLDGVVAFQRSAAAHLKGKSECAICYAIVAPDRTLPDKRCETCKNLFHRHCLYQWFQRSGQNKCPLCRNPIAMLRNNERKKKPESGWKRAGPRRA